MLEECGGLGLLCTSVAGSLTSALLVTFCFLQVIKNPVSDHLPVGCLKLGTSFAVPKVSDLRELVPTAEPVAIVVGAFAHGSVSACIPYLEL